MMAKIKITQTGSPIRRTDDQRATLKGLGPVFMESFDAVEAHLEAQNIERSGHRVGFYQNVRTENGEMTFDCVIGVEVPDDSVESDTVKLHQTPTGTAATAVYWGDYSDMHEVHEAIQQWCKTNNHDFGDNWEVYGDWDNEPSKRRTDVFYQLKS